MLKTIQFRFSRFGPSHPLLYYWRQPGLRPNNTWTYFIVLQQLRGEANYQ